MGRVLIVALRNYSWCGRSLASDECGDGARFIAGAIGTISVRLSGMRRGAGLCPPAAITDSASGAAANFSSLRGDAWPAV